MRAGKSEGGIEPFYFGTSEKPLFGCYHNTPHSRQGRSCGVVFCSPMGEEYIRFHRVYRQLAVRLSRLGFPALRFDFYGCGDSSGDSEQGDPRQWLTDVSTAVDEMRRRCGVEKICLIGLRLGGALSMMAGAARGDIDGMVLLDPVVGGRAYIAELMTLHQRMLRSSHVIPKRRPADERHAEILGFPHTASLLAGLEDIDLLTIRRKPANNILVIESNDKASQGRLKEHLQSIGAHVKYQRLPDPQFWIWLEDFDRVLVPHQILQSVVAWVSEVCT